MKRDDLANFRTWGADNRGWRPNTRTAYSRKVARTDVWLKEHRNVSVAKASTNSLMAYMSTTSTAPATRNGLRNALVAWYCYLTDTGRRRDNPAAPLPRLREPRIVPRSMSPEDIPLLLAIASAHGRKWRVAVRLLADTGMRATEACQLEWADVRDGWITVNGKGGHQRAIPKSDPLRAELRSWRGETSEPRWVLPGRWAGSHLSYQGLYYGVVQIGEAAGVEVHPHLFRSTFATQLLGAGVDVKTVQSLLGHANLATTSRYLAARDGAAEAAVDRLPWAV